MMKKNGFTLLELIAVIAIIGIIASMATVSFKGSIDNANVESGGTQFWSFLKYVTAKTKEDAMKNYSISYTTGSNTYRLHDSTSCDMNKVVETNILGTNNSSLIFAAGCNGCPICNVNVNAWQNGSCISVVNTIGSPLPQGCVTISQQGGGGLQMAVVKNGLDVRPLLFKNSGGGWQ
ncbi:MAG: prepilin-type N-terminal cleavage/methylation domain-containing protein [Fibrobacterales bacterium]